MSTIQLDLKSVAYLLLIAFSLGSALTCLRCAYFTWKYWRTYYETEDKWCTWLFVLVSLPFTALALLLLSTLLKTAS